MTLRIFFFSLLFLFGKNIFSQSDTVLTKDQKKEIKRMSSEMRGQWWLLNKKCPGYASQETRLRTQIVTDTSRPDLRIEFQKKGIVVIHDYPFMKAANGKTGTWKIQCKKSGHSAIPDKYYLILSEEIKLFLGISATEAISFKWKDKHLFFIDDKLCLFEFRPD
jgi:hypothetical protein